MKTKPSKADHHRGRVLSIVIGVAIFWGPAASSDGQLLKPIEQADSVKSEVRAIYQLTKTAKAVEHYEEILGRSRSALELPVDEDDQRYLTSLLAWAGNRLAGRLSDNADSLRQMGLNEQAEASRRAAVEHYDRVITEHPSTWRAWMGRANLHMADGEYQEALNKFEKVLELKRGYQKAIFNCAEIHAQLKQYDEAEACYAKVIKDDPTDVQARTGRAHCYLARHDFKRAIDDYQTVAQLLPNDSTALCNLGDALIHADEREKAMETFKRAASGTKPALGYERLAYCLLNNDSNPESIDAPKAKEWIEKALQAEGRKPSYLKILAQAHRVMGNPEQAQALDTELSRKQMSASRSAENFSPSTKIR